MTPESTKPDQIRPGQIQPDRDRAGDKAAAGRPAPEQPGDENLDKTRTPGDGTLDGSTPAGLTVDQLRQRAEDEGSSEPGTG